MSKRFAMFFLLTLLLALCSGQLFAQATATGTIQGTVTDASQAVVVGAEVTATQTGTGTARTAITNAAGYFRFELMPAGNYTVKITMKGFATVVQKLELLVGQTATANAALNPGGAKEVVEVTAQAPLVDQAKTSVSQDITPAQVEQLPMIGRDVASLALLAPGVKQADSYDPTKARFTSLSVDGGDGRNVNVTVNGIDNKDNTVGGPVMQLPLEGVQEYAISTQRFSAANGKSQGAAINMITKSGTNNYHGSVFGFFRNEAFNTINYEEAQGTPAKKSPYSRQFFGGSVGGPFINDKLFGFFAIERQREHTNLTEDATALSELQLVTSLGAKPAAIIPTPFFETRYNGRLDYKLSKQHSAYISYSSQGNNTLNDQSDGTQDLNAGNFTVNHMQIANATLTSVLSNTAVNSFTFGYQYWNNLIGTDIHAPLVTFPSASFGTNGNVPQQSFQRKWQFRDDLNKTVGNHALKFGADYIWNQALGGFFTFNNTLEIDFADDPSTILSDKVSYPQGFSTPGAVAGMSQSVGDPATNVPGGTKQIGFYFQDDWKVSRRLSLNLGLRWDKDINLIGGSDIPKSRTYLELKAINSPFVARLPQDDNKDFSPRFGFAYDMTGAGKHLLRGGFGIYYGNVFQNIPLFMEQHANPMIYQTVFSISTPDASVPGTGLTLGQWRYGVSPLPVVLASSQLLPGSTGRLIDPNYRNPFTEQWNVGYQWGLSQNAVLEVEYVHVLGLHENKTVTINPKDPFTGARNTDAAFAAAGVPVLGSIRDEQSVNRSRYDGMNVSYRRRMSNHFSMNANYTLSRAMGWGVQSGGNPNNGSGFRNYPHDPRNLWDPLDFGPTPNDERHHITISGIVNMPWGFELAPILQFGTARPYDLNPGRDTLGVGTGYSRPVIVPMSNPKDYVSLAGLTAKQANTCLAAKTCRQAGYDTVRGDPFFETDLRVTKNVKMGEHRNLALVFQMFNWTNRANFGNNFQYIITSKSFMKPAGFINPTATGATMARSFTGELGVRFTF
jgi:outer membrane receptor protein involved in Fe transport